MPCRILFQFTPLREGRRCPASRSLRSTPISIHAPPRGATVWEDTNIVNRIFQFTPLREGRPTPLIGFCAEHDFNSRPSARGDREGGRADSKHHDFNSRPSARGDQSGAVLRWLSTNFNSRPSARGDTSESCIRRWEGISIHAPPRGATRHAVSTVLRPHFNSRPSARGDFAVQKG